MIYDDKLVDTDFNEVIGKVLKEKRLDKKWSLLEVSRKLKKVSRQTIFHYENGDTKIRRNIFVDLCKLYEVDPDRLLDEVLVEYMKTKE